MFETSATGTRNDSARRGTRSAGALAEARDEERRGLRRARLEAQRVLELSRAARRAVRQRGGGQQCGARLLAQERGDELLVLRAREAAPGGVKAEDKRPSSLRAR